MFAGALQLLFRDLLVFPPNFRAKPQSPRAVVLILSVISNDRLLLPLRLLFILLLLYLVYIPIYGTATSTDSATATAATSCLQSETAINYRVRKCGKFCDTDAELLEMIERADTDQDGEISSEEFYSIMTKKTFT